MRAERKQELRTDALTQQWDQFREYLREHGRALTIVILVLVAGGGTYLGITRWQKSRLAEAWAKLTPPATTDPAAKIDAFRSVAEQNLDPALTLHAWLKIGDEAFWALVPASLRGNESTPPGGTPSDRDWVTVAREAYGKVLALAGHDVTAAGRATFALAWLDEYEGRLEQAEDGYKKIAGDPRFAELPFKAEAEYRLKQLRDWAEPVTFLPPEPKGHLMGPDLPFAPTPTAGEATLEPVPTPDATTFPPPTASEPTLPPDLPPAPPPSPTPVPASDLPTTQPGVRVP